MGLLAAACSVGIALRLHAALKTPLWFDEAFSWRISQAPLAELVRRIALDNHSPLYFVLLKLWTAAFGTSVLAMRTLSITAATASIVAIYALCVAALGESRGRGSSPEFCVIAAR